MKAHYMRRLALAVCVMLGAMMASSGAWAVTCAGLAEGASCNEDSQGKPVVFGICQSRNCVSQPPVPELPEILMPALLVGAGAVAYRARKKAMRKKTK